MSHLVSYKQIEGNLRRTADNGLISLLNQQQLEDLAFKYFSAIDEKTGLPGYQCPYSGIVYTNYEDIVLEHIIPVASKGGTVLFNCIPTSKEVNGSDQKGAKHLITWWTDPKSGFWDKDAPSRLEKIVNYMLDGYNLVFEEYTMEEVESSYQDIEPDKNILDEQEDKEKNKREEKKLLKQAKDNGIHSYLGFMLDCINTLDIYNIDTTEMRNKLKSLEDKHIFEDINKYQLYQNIVQKIIISRIGDDSRSYLTYTINFDIKKLIDSINLDKEEDIYNEINRRLTNIENLLQENNLSTIEYFKGLRDIQDIDIIYKNDISPDDIKIFLENIKIGIDTKIEIFIDMLNKGNIRILKRGNKETLEGYPSIQLSNFWNNYQPKIKNILFEQEKDNPKFEIARKTILDKYGVKTYEELIAKQEMDLDAEIEIFIKMLNQGNSAILKQGNKETLEGYPSIQLSNFWNNYQPKIKNILFEQEKDNPKFEIARKTILDKYGVKTYEELIAKQEMDLDAEIEIFIKMLNQGNSKILTQGNNETLEGYPGIQLSKFWSNYQPKIKFILFKQEKDNPKFEKARKAILDKYGVKTYEELIAKQDEYKSKRDLTIETKIEIFIKMLNQGNSKILTQGNNETLEGYPGIPLSNFWNNYQPKIKSILFEQEKDNPEFEKARKIILDKYGVKTYEQLIAKQDEYKSKRDLAIETKIEIFIKMLNQGNSAILKQGNIEILEGYPGIPLSQFWNNYQPKIKNILFEQEKDNHKFEKARQTVLTYFDASNYKELEFKSNLYLRITCFIKILNEGNSNILKQKNKEFFKGYPNTPVGVFWHKNKNREIIIQLLFDKLKDNSNYDTARRLILDNLKVDTIEEYYEQRESKKKKVKDDKKIKKQLEETIKMVDAIYEQLNMDEEQRKRA